MLKQLVSQAEIEAMPEEPGQRFVAIENLCRQRLAEETAGEQEWSSVTDYRVIYISTVLSAAKHLKIEPFAAMDVPRRRNFQDEVFDDFIQDIQFYVTQLMLEAAEANTRASILLEGATKQRLQTLVAHLRDHVKKLGLSPDKLDRLNARITAFERELEGQRLWFSRVAILTLAVCAVVSDLDGTGSAVSKLVHQIEEVIGKAKDTQDADAVSRLPVDSEPRRLESPRKVEPPPSRPRPKPAMEDFNRGGDFDDEIPF